MKPMLKAEFFALVTSLQSRNMTCTLRVSTNLLTAEIQWMENDALQTRTAYSVVSSSSMEYRRTLANRFSAWLDQAVMAKAAELAKSLNTGDQVVYEGVTRTVTQIRTEYIREVNGTPCGKRCTGIIVLDKTIETTADRVLLVDNSELEPVTTDSLCTLEPFGSTTPKVKAHSIRLVRAKSCQYDHEERPENRYRGRVVHMYMQITKFDYVDDAQTVERDLSAMEELLGEMGWESNNDTCPDYTGGVSCGFWVSPDELDNFRTDYMTAKKSLPKYLAKQAAEMGDDNVYAPISQPADEPEEIEIPTREALAATWRTKNQSYTNEFAILGGQVFIRAIKANNEDENAYYITADRDVTESLLERFLPCPALDAEFIRGNAAAFDLMPDRVIVLEPRRVFRPQTSDEVFKAVLLGIIKLNEPLKYRAESAL